MPDLEAFEEAEELGLVCGEVVRPALAGFSETAGAVPQGLDDACVRCRPGPWHRVGVRDGLRRGQDYLRRLRMLGAQLPPARVKPLEKAGPALRAVEQPGFGERAGRIDGGLDLPVLAGP